MTIQATPIIPATAALNALPTPLETTKPPSSPKADHLHRLRSAARILANAAIRAARVEKQNARRADEAAPDAATITDH